MNAKSWVTPATFALVAAGAAMMSVSMGTRQTMGLLIGPLSLERGWPLATFSLAVALQNLLWGAFQPFTGAAADRWGAARVAAFGALASALGLWLAAQGGAMALIVGLGLVAGLGLASTSFAVVLGPVGRAVAPEERTRAMGTASAAGSIGMMAMIPVAQFLIPALGASKTMNALAVIALASIPLALILGWGERTAANGAKAQTMGGQPLRAALGEAMGHRGFQLLILGFFVCGFQIAYIGVHLPGYLQLCGMGAGAGATALLVIGLFNTLGTWGAGQMGRWMRPKFPLAAIYLLRAAATMAFVFGPKNEAALLAFAAVIGLLWLSTVPLTSGLIACVFGPKHLGALFGIVFFSHQVGGFLGAWLGGLVYDATLSYDLMWMATAVLGVMAALVHLPIADRKLEREAQ